MRTTLKHEAATGRLAHAKAARGSNQTGVRAHNERLVLTLIRQMGPLAKADIARLTGLSAQTVSVIMRRVEADGLLEKGEPVRGRVGQPSVPMNLAADGAYFLGLKVGRRSLDLVLTDFLGRVEGRMHLTHHFPQPDRVVSFANDAIAQLLAELTPDQQARVAGLGIAIPFWLWDWARDLGVKPEDMACWRDRDIAEEIGANWDFPIYLRNDASAACGAELVFGDQNKPRDFLYFFVGFFIGGGMVLDNTLFTGRTGNAAAFGSMPVMGPNGEARKLLDMASLVELERALAADGFDGTVIWERSDAWELPAAILDDWIEIAASGLAQAIVSSACLIDFEWVVIDGWLPRQVLTELVRRTRAELTKTDVAGVDLPQVREGTIGSDARSLGAASLPLSDRFLVDRKAF